MAITADHLNNVTTSAVTLVTAKARQLEREGFDIIRLSAGEPDCGTPEHIKLAGVAAIEAGKTQYPLVQGVMELREAICRKLLRDNRLSYTPEQILVSCGCKQTIFNAFAATLNPDDEVIIPTPYFPSYPSMIEINRGVPVFVKTEQKDRLKLTRSSLEQAITPRTKWLILNNPGNPSGAVYSREELVSLANVLKRHPQVWILSDDIYEFLIFGDAKFYSILEVAPELKERTLVVNGVSKAYAMTGWRVGYGAGPVELIKTMMKVQSQSTSGTSTISQWAAVEALDGDHGDVARYNDTLVKRRDLVVKMINGVDGLSCAAPDGAFYCYISCAGIIGKTTPSGKVISCDLDFSNFLMDECGVAVVHGEAFGLSPFFRISYATSIELLEKACRKIIEACEQLN